MMCFAAAGYMVSYQLAGSVCMQTGLDPGKINHKSARLTHLLCNNGGPLITFKVQASFAEFAQF